MTFLGIKTLFLLYSHNEHIIHQHIRALALESEGAVTANK